MHIMMIIQDRRININGLKVGGKKWTTEEIREDVMKVCRQLKDIENKEKYSKKEE